MSVSSKGISFARIILDTSQTAPVGFSSAEELEKILSETNEKIHTGVIEFIGEEGLRHSNEPYSKQASSLVFNQTHTDAIMSAFESVLLRGNDEDRSSKTIPDTKTIQSSLF